MTLFPKTLPSILLIVILLSAAPSFAKDRPKKKGAVPDPITYELRVKEWSASMGVSRGAPLHLCEKEHQALLRLKEFVSQLNERFLPLPPKKIPHFESAIQILGEEPSPLLDDDPDWEQFKLQRTIKVLDPLLSEHAGVSAWPRQETLLHQYLMRMRGAQPYTVAEQAEPFNALKDLLAIKRGVEALFEEMDRADVEWNRLLDFNRLEILKTAATPQNRALKNTVDPILECHIDYLSHF